MFPRGLNLTYKGRIGSRRANFWPAETPARVEETSRYTPRIRPLIRFRPFGPPIFRCSLAVMINSREASGSNLGSTRSRTQRNSMVRYFWARPGTAHYYLSNFLAASPPLTPRGAGSPDFSRGADWPSRADGLRFPSTLIKIRTFAKPRMFRRPFSF